MAPHGATLQNLTRIVAGCDAPLCLLCLFTAVTKYVYQTLFFTFLSVKVVNNGGEPVTLSMFENLLRLASTSLRVGNLPSARQM